MAANKKSGAAPRSPLEILHDALDQVEQAGITLAHMKANGKIRLDEDSRAWLEELENSIEAAAATLATAIDKAEET